MESLVDPLKVMVKVFRRECHRVLHSERTSIHGADGMLMVLHLAMAEVNKQHGGEFKVALSDVLMAWKHLVLHKLHLPPPGFARSGNYDLILEMYESFLKRSNTMDLVDIFSMYKQLRIVDLDPEEPLSPAQFFEFLSGSSNEFSEQPESTIPSTPLSKSRSWSSQVKMAVRRVFCSYLSLLVNSKNDMALAVTLDVPSRCLGRQAFTDIKRAARNSNTSLFLAVTSFVRAIQLGGKGYAPADSDPLRKHVKGLSDFVQFIDNLEEILGEVTDPSACGSRLVAAIRAALVKGRNSGDAVFTSAHETAQELNERICQLHHIQKQSSANGGGTGISPARPKAYTINHATAFGGRDTVKVLMALLDEEALTPPCQNKAELLSEDQPVLSGIEANSILSLFRSPEVSTGCSPEPLRNRVQSRRDLLKPKAKDRVIRSQFACTYKDEELPLNRVLEFPSTSQVPTCVHPAPKPQTIPSECGSDVKETNKDTESTSTIPKAKPSTEYPHTERSIVPRGAALGQKSGNAQNRVAGSVDRKKSGIQRQPKTNKRKQVDCEQHGRSENEPPQKKQPTSISVKMPGKTVTKASSKRKLIAGQGKLTSFFRV